MSRRKRPVGECRICGAKGALSFEHVPPKSAFNNRPVIVATTEDAVSSGPRDRLRGRTQQMGMGAYSLCESCNNQTGHWYGGYFVDWCYQGMELLYKSGGKPTLYYPYHLFPLAVIKQVVTMFFSINGPWYRTIHPELEQFVLDRDRRYLSPKYRIFVYYNIEGRARAAGTTGVLRLDGNDGKTIMLTEISFPPFGYVMTFESDPPDARLVEITHFSRYQYKEFATLQLRLPTLPTHLAFPGDYRTVAEIDQQVADNQAWKASRTKADE